MFWDDTGVPWVLPSPNMPTLETAIVYPGQVLFEGTMLSEARGTTRPFELCGAPWLDANALASRLNAYRLPGAAFRPVTFEPTFHKHAKTPCHGVQIHVTDRRTFESVLASTAVLHEMRQMDPAQFTWRPPPYEYEHKLLPIDILAGTATYREDIERGTDPRRMAGRGSRRSPSSSGCATAVSAIGRAWGWALRCGQHLAGSSDAVVRCVKITARPIRRSRPAHRHVSLRETRRSIQGRIARALHAAHSPPNCGQRGPLLAP
jgi:hypothetical protein